jgi:transposase
VKAFTYWRVKNDELDARDLADLLRMGRLHEAWIAPQDVRDLRELTRYRAKLVSVRTSAKDQVHAVLAKLGIPVTDSDLFGKGGNAWLDEMAPAARAGRVRRSLQPVQATPDAPAGQPAHATAGTGKPRSDQSPAA